jgi:alkylation response protein AidB-like acyl-CoA dehydrogenase
MPIYKSPVQDYLFLLNDVFHIERYADVPGYAALSPDIVEATLTEAARLADDVFAPLNRVGDSEGCTRHEDGSVTTPRGFKEAFAQYRDGGWNGLRYPEEYGGQDLPGVLAGVLSEFMAGANISLAMYGGLTRGAIAALLRHGSDELKRVYLPKMVASEWTGTMNLTEAHAGTDLGLLRTRASRRDDGSFAITGTKIFISAGEHDWPRTSSTSCSHASKARRAACTASRCSSCRSSSPPRTGPSARAMRRRAAPSNTRWASTATPPAS